MLNNAAASHRNRLRRLAAGTRPAVAALERRALLSVEFGYAPVVSDVDGADGKDVAVDALGNFCARQFRRNHRCRSRAGSRGPSASQKSLAAARLVLAVAAVSCFTSATYAQSFVPLGFLPGGQSFSEAQGVSADGSFVVGLGVSPQGTGEAFRWSAVDGMIGIGPAVQSNPNRHMGISADGSVIVGSLLDVHGRTNAFRWTAASGQVLLGSLPGAETDISEAFGVSADGSVVAGISFSSSGPVGRAFEAFRWTAAGGMVGLGDLPGGTFGSQGIAISANGSVIVGSGDSGVGSQEAFRWTAAGGMEGMGDLPTSRFSNSLALGASRDGSVIVGMGRSGHDTEAFRWTAAGGMVGLGDLPGGSFESYALGVSGDGSVVVGRSFISGFETDAFIWDNDHGMRNLRQVLIDDFGLGTDLAGWRLNSARAISTDGRTIVGSGLNPSGQAEGWLVRLASQIRWLESTGGAFDAGENWNPARVPGPDDKVLFDLDATYTVQLDRDFTVRALEVRQGHVTFAGPGVAVSVAAAGDTASGPFQDLQVRELLTVAPSGILSLPANMHVRSAVGMVDGRMFINGDSSSWLASEVNVGFGGDGSIDVRNGGDLTTGTLRLGTGNLKKGTLVVSDAALVVTGPLQVGSSNGVGNVSIENGGRATLGGLAVSSSGAFSHLVVSGVGADGRRSGVSVQSVFDPSSDIVVGESGHGEISVLNGALFTSSQGMIVAGPSGGTGAVNVLDDANLEVPALTLAHRGLGHVEARNGGQVDVSGLLRVGSGEAGGGSGHLLSAGRSTGDSSRSAKLTADRLELHQGSVQLAEGGAAVMNSASIGESGRNAFVEISDGFFDVGNDLTIGSTGHLRMTSGLVTVGQSLAIGPFSGRVTVGSGTVMVGNAPSSISDGDGKVFVFAGGRLSGSGVITGNVIAAGGEIEFVGIVNGTVGPGNSPGTLSIDGDFELRPGGVLEIEIGGLLPDSQHDVLSVSGDLLLNGGALVLQFIDGFAPLAGQRFSFMEIGGLVDGSLKEVRIENLQPGFEFDLSFDNGQVTMAALNDGIAIPEPGGAALAIAGASLLLGGRRSRGA